MNSYEKEAKARFGETAAYGEYQKKTANYNGDKWQEVSEGLTSVFARFAECMKNGDSADSESAQALVKVLQDYITENFYTCAKEILLGLGQMYVADERFRENIDKNAPGTAEFASKAIEIYSGK